MGLSRSERLVLVLLSVAILAGRAARFGCGDDEFAVTRAEDAAVGESARAETPSSVGATAAAGSAGAGAVAAAGGPVAAANARAERAAPPEPEISADAPLDINAAAAADFERLPGIGPAKARAIVERREAIGGFRAVSDLLDVPGIGPKTLERLEGLVVVKGAHREDVGARTEETN